LRYCKTLEGKARSLYHVAGGKRTPMKRLKKASDAGRAAEEWADFWQDNFA